MNGTHAMNQYTVPTLEESAEKNSAVTAARVREMREVVKILREKGIIQPPKYTLSVGLKRVPNDATTACGCSCRFTGMLAHHTKP